MGRIRRVAFFNRLLTEAEMTKLYAARNLDESPAAVVVQPPVQAPVVVQPPVQHPTGNVQAIADLKARAAELRKTADQLDAIAEALST